MRLSILFFFLFSTIIILGQEKIIPKKTLLSPSLLAHYLTDDIPDAKGKVRAIHKWVTSNIDYDYKSLSSDKVFESKKGKDILKSKKTICNGYVSLIRTMLEEINIESEEVAGYVPESQVKLQDKTYLDTHSWIAINIDGKWKMADPTWDAGYIGNIPKKVNEKKLKKKETKRVKKNKKREAKGLPLIPAPKKGEIEYTGKVGFVSDPKETWFLSENDSFLLKHLPVNPMWQIRTDTIGINTFYLGSDSLYSIISKKNRNENYLYEQELRKYLGLNFLDKLIFVGDDGFSYYNQNYRIKAINYYNYLSVLNNKEVKKQYKDLPVSIGQQLNESMLVKIDTALFYSKLYDKAAKVRYKEIKSFYGVNYKGLKKTNKQHLKLSEKNTKYNEGALKELAKTNTRIEQENKKIDGALEKMNEKYSGLTDYDFKAVSFSMEPIQLVLDSIEILEDDFIMLDSAWCKAKRRLSLQSIYNNMEYNKYLLKYRKESLEQKSIEYNILIDTIDIILNGNFIELEKLYLDSLKLEILPKNFYQMTKKIQASLKGVQSLVKEKEASGEIKNSRKHMKYLRAKVVAQYNRMLMINYDALAYNEWLEGYLKEFKSNWKPFNKGVREQEGLTKKRLDSMLEEAEHDHNREIDLSKIIKRDSKKWAEIIKSK